MLPGYLWELSRGGGMDFNVTTLAGVGYTGIFASVVAFLCYNAAIVRIGPIVASFFLHLMPVFGGAMAIVFLGENLRPYHFLGFAVVLAGIFVSTTRTSRQVRTAGFGVCGDASQTMMFDLKSHNGDRLHCFAGRQGL